MQRWTHAFLYVVTIFIQNAFAAPNAGSFYSSNGGILDNCRISPCDYTTTKCPNGQYLTGCGGTSDGTCLACSGPPASAGSNAVWTSNGGSSGSSTACQWGCNAGYGKDSTSSSCISTTCGAVANSEFINSNYQVCTYQCAAGYFSSSTVNANGPVTCTECTQGTFTSSANAATTCTKCAAGKFSSALHATACTNCAVDIYTLASDSGRTACTSCTLVNSDTPTCDIGKWRSGCGGQNTGTCVSCGNIANV